MGCERFGCHARSSAPSALTVRKCERSSREVRCRTAANFRDGDTARLRLTVDEELSDERDFRVIASEDAEALHSEGPHVGRCGVGGSSHGRVFLPPTSPIPYSVCKVRS